MYKDTLRILSKRLLKHISKEERKQYLNQISTRLYETDWWVNSEVIAMTIARDIELDTLPIIEEGWKQGKQIAVPKCNPANHEMNFYIFSNQHELENVYLDLYEPKANPNKLVKPSEIELIIVPGLLFDHQGYRIGYGGGYYDRYLSNYHQAKISLAMEQQVVKHVPYDEHDRPVDAVLTEKNMY